LHQRSRQTAVFLTTRGIEPRVFPQMTGESSDVSYPRRSRSGRRSSERGLRPFGTWYRTATELTSADGARHGRLAYATADRDAWLGARAGTAHGRSRAFHRAGQPHYGKPSGS